MQDSQIIRTEYSELMKKSYIDYAMCPYRWGYDGKISPAR